MIADCAVFSASMGQGSNPHPVLEHLGASLRQQYQAGSGSNVDLQTDGITCDEPAAISQHVAYSEVGRLGWQWCWRE